jgi:hypothetical protein
MTFVTGSPSRAQKVLHPFRTAVSPIADQSVVLSSLFEVSHVGDENLETMPHRIHVQAAIMADVWSDTVMEVWKRWCVFTEKEDCDQTAILWEIDLRGWGKEGAVGKEETAFHARDPHYSVIIWGRYVPISYIIQTRNETTDTDLATSSPPPATASPPPTHTWQPSSPKQHPTFATPTPSKPDVTSASRCAGRQGMNGPRMCLVLTWRG